MVLGLSEADCRAAEFRFRALCADAARQRRAAFAPRLRRAGSFGGEALRARMGTFLVWAGERLGGVPTADAAHALPTASGLRR